MDASVMFDKELGEKMTEPVWKDAAAFARDIAECWGMTTETRTDIAERVEIYTTELAAENARLRAALERLLGELPQPNLDDPDLDDAIDQAAAVLENANHAA